MTKVKFGLRFYSQEQIDRLRTIAEGRTGEILNRIQKYLNFKTETGKDPELADMLSI